jgi:hypothetical protein
VADREPKVGTEPRGRDAFPPASFGFLVASVAAQAQVALGKVENPLTKKSEVSLPAAKHAIDLLEVLEAKTKGNLEPNEIALLSHVLWDLRLAYVQAKEGDKA